MKIGIIGCNDAEFAAMSLAMAKMNHEVVMICDDDITETDCEALVTKESVQVFCGHPLANIGIEIPDAVDHINMPKRDNSFRGGSRGKSGKIKYARR